MKEYYHLQTIMSMEFCDCKVNTEGNSEVLYMQYSDEKDYIMRMIKEMVRMLFTLMLGKEYTHVELPAENRFEISGRKLEEYKAMVDRGEINEAENLLLENVDYDSKDEVAGAAFFYRYISEKEEEFLQAHNYSTEEALDGLKQLAKRAGYDEVYEILL